MDELNNTRWWRYEITSLDGTVIYDTGRTDELNHAWSLGGAICANIGRAIADEHPKKCVLVLTVKEVTEL